MVSNFYVRVRQPARRALMIFCLAIFPGLWGMPVQAEKVFFAGYKDGFYIRTEQEGGMEVRLGGAFQADYRYFFEDERADNGFDIRRARLVFRGQLTEWVKFGLEYEFQGNETKNLVDAYGELAVRPPHAIRFGQFKAPFSLEWQTRDKGLFFAERSMGYDLTPKRDIGVMAHGGIFGESIYYGFGLFNGDGVDGSTSGNMHDEPEIAGRLTVRPFRYIGPDWARGFQVGGSLTWAEIDLPNVNLDVGATGMAGNDRSLYVLTSNTKFGVLRDVGRRIRWGLEAAWVYNRLAVAGEVMGLTYTDLKPSGGDVRDADFTAGYLSAAFCVTGEQPVLSEGAMKPLRPDHFFNPDEGTFGALVLAGRYARFEGDGDWIQADAHVSAESADAVSLAANWILYPMHRIILDYTHTEFSDPLRVRVHPDGRIDYVDRERVVTVRWSTDF